MCGIYGIIDPCGVDSECLDERRDRLIHRGPDDAGSWVSPDGCIGLAHRRLAIIDLTDAGHQPMHSPDDRYTIVYNGEIYNFKALRKELTTAGFRFASSSDTEVVLAAYAQWGTACIDRFNGMFALAIYDKGDDETPASLFLARDRAGKKPLYYSFEGGRLQFASELKALAVSDTLNLQALNHYLALGYIPRDQCFLAAAKKLPPAHAALVDITQMTIHVYRYWQLPTNPQNGHEDVAMLTDKAASLLKSAVGLRLISDVPVGVLLSGGLDSSLVVAAAAAQMSEPVKTFTISVPGTPFDEAPHAARVAAHFGTDHHVLEMTDLSMDLISEIGHGVDEPIADSSLIPTYIVSRLTRAHVTVALGGDGGDELFGGYGDYPVSLMDQKRWGWLPGPLLRTAAAGAALLPAGVRGRNRLASLRGGPLQQLIWGSPYFDIALRRRVLHPDAIAALTPDLEAPERFLLELFHQGNQPVDAMTRTHFGSILPDDFLVKVDRASMAHSLEMRSPMLDHRLVEFCFSQVPDSWKVVKGDTRRLQKRLARRMLPTGLDIERKQGFSIPIDLWLREDRCERLRDHISNLPDAIDRHAVNTLIDGHMKGRTNGARLYALLILGIAMKNLHTRHELQ